MSQIDENIVSAYGEKLRVRVCGICIEQGKILLVHHKHLGQTGSLWAPPGGGMEYGENAEEALQREFLEETGLEIHIEKFLFVHEYLDPPLHGIELFFEVKRNGGRLTLGSDPEIQDENQILTHVGFYDFKKIQAEQMTSLHYVLQNTDSLSGLINQKGYFKFH